MYEPTEPKPSWALDVASVYLANTPEAIDAMLSTIRNEQLERMAELLPERPVAWEVASDDERKAYRAQNLLAKRERERQRDEVNRQRDASKADAMHSAAQAHRDATRALIVNAGGLALSADALERMIDERIMADLRGRMR